MADLALTLVNVQRFSTEDGPGIRTTVFLKGCPMRCPWCQNPETVHSKPEVVWHPGRCLGDRGCIRVCPGGALSADHEGIHIDGGRCVGCGRCVDFCPSEALEIHGRIMPVDELASLLERDATFYETSGGGVTLSGGEPLAQPEGVIALLRMLRRTEPRSPVSLAPGLASPPPEGRGHGEGGIHTAIDTCGAGDDGALGAMLDLVDLVLFDVKTVDPQKHRRMTGVPFERVAASARTVAASGVPVWIRTPIIPGYTDEDGDVRAVARFVAETFGPEVRHELLAFSNLCRPKYEQLGRTFPLRDEPLLTSERMDHLVKIAMAEGSLDIVWTGLTRP